jgi:hypothetical protein
MREAISWDARMPQAQSSPRDSMNKALLIDSDEQHAEGLMDCLRRHRLVAERVLTVEESLQVLRLGTPCRIVIVNVSDHRLDWLTALRTLSEAGYRAGGFGSLSILCVSRTAKPVDFILRIERLGCRYVFER